MGGVGLAGYSSLLEIGKPEKGQTILVSAAAGPVGQTVGQVAKLHGLRVVGVVGSDEKLDLIVTTLGFDARFNYKSGGMLENCKEVPLKDWKVSGSKISRP